MRSNVDVAKVVLVAIDNGGVVQRAGVDSLCSGSPFLGEADICPAPRAKPEVQPTSGIIDGSIEREVAGGQLKVRRLPFRDHRKCGAGAPLAPFAMTDNDDVRVAYHLISDVAADAAPFVNLLTH